MLEVLLLLIKTGRSTKDKTLKIKYRNSMHKYKPYFQAMQNYIEIFPVVNKFLSNHQTYSLYKNLNLAMQNISQAIYLHLKP